MKPLKIQFIVGICILTISWAHSQNLTNDEIKDSIINNINTTINREIAKSDMVISASDSLVKELIKQSPDIKGNRNNIENLKSRIAALEEKNEALREKEIKIYYLNYQTALANLAFLEADIKPLKLLSSSQAFFSNIQEISNPSTYDEYQDWFTEFKEYVNDNKEKEAKLKVLNEMLSLSSSLTNGMSLSGPVVGSLFDGISLFINSLGWGQKDLKVKSEKMYALTMLLSQYTNDVNKIEDEWDEIANSLGELNNNYKEALVTNLNLIDEDTVNFNKKYVKENDGKKKLDYLNDINEKAQKKVVTNEESNKENWKDEFFYEMDRIQSLKIQFANITEKIKNNFSEYDKLIDRYKEVDFLKKRMQSLEKDLNELKSSFDDSYRPIQYKQDAIKMYRAY